MFHNAKRLERVTCISVSIALAAVLAAAGCSPQRRREHEPKPVTATAQERPAPTAPGGRIVDEELIGPPAPPTAAAEIEGPPEPVGPPTPDLQEQAEAPAREARATEPDAALMASLAAIGTDVHPSARGPVVVFPDTIFELGTATLQREAKRKIHDIGRVVSERAFRSRVAVEGHSDSTGAEMYNRGLSERRANAVAAELASAGVAKKHVSAKGYGSQFPIAPNERADGSDDPQGRARNRRVEVVIETATEPGV